MGIRHAFDGRRYFDNRSAQHLHPRATRGPGSAEAAIRPCCRRGARLPLATVLMSPPNCLQWLWRGRTTRTSPGSAALLARPPTFEILRLATSIAPFARARKSMSTESMVSCRMKGWWVRRRAARPVGLAHPELELAVALAETAAGKGRDRQSRRLAKNVQQAMSRAALTQR